MPRTLSFRLVLACALAAVSAISVGVPQPALAKTADGLLKSGDYAGAVAAYQQEEAKRPKDARIKRNLGAALLKSGEADSAVTKLEEAHAAKPADQATLYLLGLAQEARRDTTAAIDAYRQYLARGGPETAAVRVRTHRLIEAQTYRAVRKAIAREKKIRIADVPANTIAVPDFASGTDSDSLRPLCRGLAVVMTTDLGKVPQLRVLERERLSVLLDELDRTAPGPPRPRSVARTPSPIAPTTAPRFGRLLGARRFAQGTILPLDQNRIQLSASLVEIARDSVYDAGPPADGPMPQVLGLEKTIVFQVLESLRIPIDDNLRREIGKPPTKSYPAFLAFCRGVDFEARGLFPEAAAAYEEALRSDPHFTLASERSDVVSATATSETQSEARLLLAVASAPSSSDRNDRSDDALAMGPKTSTSSTAATAGRLNPAARVNERTLLVGISFR